jgi:hypothetical protein
MSLPSRLDDNLGNIPFPSPYLTVVQTVRNGAGNERHDFKIGIVARYSLARRARESAAG